MRKRIMNDLREQRQKLFTDTKQWYESHAVLTEAIENSKKQQCVIDENQVFAAKNDNVYDTPANVIVSKKRSLEAAMGYPKQKVCVLNFASASNPGGGVEKGSNAQEEAICRCSTLYPCISEQKVSMQFHQKHRTLLKNEELSALYNDDCIYTPGVIVFKTDTNIPVLMSEDKWYQVDIISCAAPNLRSRPSNSMNPNSGKKAVSIKPNQLLELHIKRIKRVFEIAKAKQEDVLVLGAFGCGGAMCC